MKKVKKDNANQLIGLGLNLLIIVLEVIGLMMTFMNNGVNSFLYYTVDSNILLLISSIVLCYFYINHINNKQDKKCKIFSVFRYISVLSVLVTFFVVITILSPQYGFVKLLFTDEFLPLHLLCPAFAGISFIFFEKYKYTNMDTFRSLYYTFIYAIVLIIFNLLKIVDGPYPFLQIYNQSIIASILWFIAIVGGAACFSLIIRFLNKKFCLVKE